MPSPIFVPYINTNSVLFVSVRSFISTLLTAILTNHLGWVASVAPLPTSHGSFSAQKCAKISEISRLHPYNALWAQLGDLYGAIGHPTKISKTIVCGNETLLMNKLLNVLTYFIRCGEIRRSAPCEVIDQDEIRNILRGATQPQAQTVKSKGLTRSATCLKDLTVGDTNGTANGAPIAGNEDKNIMNDIPNVLAFRNSRFVRQELRVGNHLMDTGIEMNQQQKRKIEAYQVKGPNGIKLTVTNCDSIDGVEAAAEAIDYELSSSSAGDMDEINSLSRMITANSLGTTRNNTAPVKLMWGMERVKEGIIEEKEKKLKMQSTDELNRTFPEDKTEHSGRELKRSKSLIAKSVAVLNQRRERKPSSQEPMSYHSDVDLSTADVNAQTKLKSMSSLSDLITANSVGVSDRLQWGIERVKEGICTEEEMHFDIAAKRIQMEHNLNPNSNVVFMLGDNDVLAGLRPQTPTLSYADDQQTPNKCKSPTAAEHRAIVCSATNATATSSPKIEKKKKCTHKKHSGVKFNFEQYPQIVTNYMKNKNLDLGDYDFLEKGLKLAGFGASTSMLPPPISLNDTKIDEEEEEETCECCANSSRILQTPSNATELEFSSDDISYPAAVTPTPQTIGNAKEIVEIAEVNRETTTASSPDEESRKTREISVIHLPIPKSIDTQPQGSVKPGFVPSLFVGITDHYISDMVLQVTSAIPPNI